MDIDMVKILEECKDMAKGIINRVFKIGEKNDE